MDNSSTPREYYEAKYQDWEEAKEWEFRTAQRLIGVLKGKTVKNACLDTSFANNTSERLIIEFTDGSMLDADIHGTIMSRLRSSLQDVKNAKKPK